MPGDLRSHSLAWDLGSDWVVFVQSQRTQGIREGSGSEVVERCIKVRVSGLVSYRAAVEPASIGNPCRGAGLAEGKTGVQKKAPLSA